MQLGEILLKTTSGYPISSRSDFRMFPILLANMAVRVPLRWETGCFQGGEKVS
jgi:hypothetical protein